MISIDEAFSAVDERVGPLAPVRRRVREARGRVLASPAVAATDLPPFRQSAMDGYALRSADTEGASPSEPAELTLAGTRPAGPAAGEMAVAAGEAVRIYTGARLPEGADAVLRQEDAVIGGGTLAVERPVEAGTAVRERGEELREDAVLAAEGQRLTSGHLGGLAVAGVERVTVRPAPRVRVLVTGDEVVGPDTELAAGQVYDANTPLVTGWLAARGIEPASAGHLPDDPGATREALAGALADADLVLTTGGVSVGDRDFVLDAARDVGVEEVFWRVRQKPGKPLFFGVLDGSVLLGLPGNPGSVHACLLTHVRRVLGRMEGEADPGPRMRPGRLAADFPRDPLREWWARCRVEVGPEGGVRLAPLDRQASHMIAELGRAEALARLPRGEGTAEAGTSVPWTPAAGWEAWA